MRALSFEYAFYHAALKRTAFDPHSGIGMSDILAAVENEVQPKENGWPYLDQRQTEIPHCKPPVDVGPLYRRGSQHQAGLAVILMMRWSCSAHRNKDLF